MSIANKCVNYCKIIIAIHNEQIKINERRRRFMSINTQRFRLISSELPNESFYQL